MVGRRGSQETVRGGSSVGGSELTELFLMSQFLGPLCFQQLLMLESELGVLRLEELLLLQLNHVVRFLQFFLASQLRSGNTLLLLLQGCCSDRGNTRCPGGRECRGEGWADCRRDSGSRNHAGGSGGCLRGSTTNDELGGVTRLRRWLVHTGEVGRDCGGHRKVE